MENINISDKNKIEYLDNLICACGNDLIDYYNNYIRFNKSEKNVMTIDEYVKLLNEDDHFRIILAFVKQKTLKKIHNWIMFIGVLVFFLAGVYFVYVLVT